MRRGTTRLSNAVIGGAPLVPKRPRAAEKGAAAPLQHETLPIQTTQDVETEESATRRRKIRRTSTTASSLVPERLCFFLSEPACHLRVCTSGYHYDHWHVSGSIYDGISEKQEFSRYSAEFDCVELNATFYRWFRDGVFEGWKARAAAVRPSFQYIVKAHQFYTHWKRLNVDDQFKESWGRFWQSCQLLGEHLGPVLFQFPENFKLHPSPAKQTKKRGGKEENQAPAGEEPPQSNLARLEALGAVLPSDGRFVFEFRDSSWFCEEVYEVLRRHNWCLALVEVSGKGLGLDDNGK